MTPAELVIERFGSQKAVADATGLRPSAIVHWTKTGIVPAKHHRTLLAEAAKRSIRLSLNELISPPVGLDGTVEPPQALYAGELRLGAVDDDAGVISCYVLEDGRRVISRSAALGALAGGEGRRTGGDLEAYVRPLGYRMQQRLNDELIEFRMTGVSKQTFGITAEFFLEICKAYVHGRDAGVLTTDRQNTIAIQANAFLAACAGVGLIALIDEATGYQYERAEDALRMKLQLFLEDEMRAWEKTFPDELWTEFGRLTGWEGSLQARPKYWGKLVMELVYEPLDTDVAEWLKANAPTPRHGQNYHQWLSGQYGLKKLIEHIWMVIGMARACNTMQELRYRMAEQFGKQPLQIMMFVDPPRASWHR